MRFRVTGTEIEDNQINTADLFQKKNHILQVQKKIIMDIIQLL